MNTVNKVTKKVTQIKTIEPKFQPHYIETYDADNNNLKDILILDSGEDVDITYKHTINNEYHVNFNIEQLAHCCAVLEIGELNIDSRFPIKNLIEILDIIPTVNKETIVINTNGVDSSILFEQALIKCKNWTKVKSFKSKSGNRTIIMWVSNN